MINAIAYINFHFWKLIIFTKTSQIDLLEKVEEDISHTILIMIA
jgi:hypothetical protein